MLVTHGTTQAGPPRAEESGWHFTGRVWSYLSLPPADGVVINSVCFEPSARTFWHAHSIGQILHVLAGRGFVQADGEPAVALHVGDTVWTPQGERHWHGAAPDSYMVHLAISLGSAEWQEEVSAVQYRSAGA